MATEPKSKKSISLATKDLPDTAFKNLQLDLFQNFVANNKSESDLLSNTIDLWDNVPRYSISRIKQSDLRSIDGFLPIRNINFQYQSRAWQAQIRPARIEQRDKDGVLTGKSIEYYPSAREELIEHALRKLATQQNLGYLDLHDYRSGVSFSLHKLRKELIERGHAMKYADIVESLDILNLSNIRIINLETNKDAPSLVSQAYLPVLLKVNKAGATTEPEARWLVQFHSALTQSMDQLTYRQFNYSRLMRCKSQLSRWLIFQLVLKYTFASLIDPFKLLFSTVHRDSGLLNYTEKRKGVDALDMALEEIQTEGVLMTFEKNIRSGSRGSITDVEYILKPTAKFAAEQKAANLRGKDNREVLK